MSTASQKVMITGARPTGALHLGHYVGAQASWVAQQHHYNLHILIADVHMLTTKNSKEDIAQAADKAREMVKDSIAAGVDPARVTFYLQSAIPEIYEFYTLLQSLVTVPRLERLPSLKEMAQGLTDTEMPFALLGYPVLQAADVLCLNADVVPVGKDNAAHIEITREIARRFNFKYGETLKEPETLFTETPLLIGTDGKAKMSKSLGNAINLSDDTATVQKKVRSMFTDPNRIRADIPGTVEGNPVFIYHDIFTPDKALVEDMKTRYRAGNITDTEVKDHLITSLETFLAPIRERRAALDAQPSGYVDKLIKEGTEKTRELVQHNLKAMKKAMGISGIRNAIWRKAEQAG